MPVVLHAKPAVHVREHKSLLAAAEKQLLVWIARHLPQWVGSDHLSLMGLASMVGAGACLVARDVTPWAIPAAVVALGLNWFGDSLDGTVARVRQQERPRFGYYVDHIIDLAGTGCLMGGLAVSGIMSPTIALLVLLGYGTRVRRILPGDPCRGRISHVVCRLRPHRVEDHPGHRPHESGVVPLGGCAVARIGQIVRRRRHHRRCRSVGGVSGDVRAKRPCTARGGTAAPGSEREVTRLTAFVTVGGLGFLLQLTALASLSEAHWNPLLATATAVELAVLHNFWWHQRWTWNDRQARRSDRWLRFVRYHAATGMTTIGNVIVTMLLVEAGIGLIAANALAVAAMSVANFRLSDRWIFLRGGVLRAR